MRSTSARPQVQGKKILGIHGARAASRHPLAGTEPAVPPGYLVCPRSFLAHAPPGRSLSTRAWLQHAPISAATWRILDMAIVSKMPFHSYPSQPQSQIAMAAGAALLRRWEWSAPAACTTLATLHRSAGRFSPVGDALQDRLQATSNTSYRWWFAVPRLFERARVSLRKNVPRSTDGATGSRTCRQTLMTSPSVCPTAEMQRHDLPRLRV